MPKRELFALVAIPLLLGIIVWLPAWVLLAVVGIAATIAADELLAMARGAGIPCGRWLPLACLVGLLAASWGFGPLGFLFAGGTTLMVIPTAQLAHRQRPAGSLVGSAVSCFVVLFLGLVSVSVGWIRLWPDEDLAIRIVLLYLGTIWVGDSGAYYVGSRIGRHKMSPRISPNKTWEGLIGGTSSALVAAALLKVVLQLEMSWPSLIGLAVILAITTPIGDLVESQFKRDTRVKDSSTLLPGHGGLLDRTDSLFYAAPPTLLYLVLTGLIS